MNLLFPLGFTIVEGKKPTVVFFCFQDETLVERLIGLTEMFPEEVRNFGYSSGVCMTKLAKGCDSSLIFDFLHTFLFKICD